MGCVTLCGYVYTAQRLMQIIEISIGFCTHFIGTFIGLGLSVNEPQGFICIERRRKFLLILAATPCK